MKKKYALLQSSAKSIFIVKGCHCEGEKFEPIAKRMKLVIIISEQIARHNRIKFEKINNLRD